jgi:hypothetical protein
MEPIDADALKRVTTTSDHLSPPGGSRDYHLIRFPVIAGCPSF